MPSDVIVTPEILAGQSAEMSSLMAEYESLFTSVSSLLTEINGSWSPNMANNFSGKIQSAQKSFSNVVGMLGNGASAAKAASQIYADDLAGAAGVLSLLTYEEKMKDSPIALVFAAAVILYTTVYGFIMLFGEGSKLRPIEMILVICIIIAGLTFLIGHGMNYALYRQNKRR